jgi:predicted ferric reductase
MKFKKNLPTIIIIVLALVPIARWFFLKPMSFRFSDFNSTMTSLGQITGLLGMILFSINLILSNRSRFFDKFFSGLHIFYDHHKWIGVVSFCFLLFHPLFLVAKYVTISIYDAAMFLLPGNNFPVTLGIIALGSMIVLLVITLYLKIKYHIWRFSHKFMTLVFVFAILHTLFITSDISRDMFLRYYILVFAFWGLIFGVYRAFFRIFFNRDFEFEVMKVNMLNNNVTEIEMKPKGFKIKFYPGQFIFIRFVGVGISSEPHPFSITSFTGENNIKIIIKSLGDYTSTINNLTPGTIAKVEGPFGNFYKNKNSNKKEIWIAGGVGITPFLSMARSLGKIDFDVDLYYCLKNKNEAVLLNELEAISLSSNKFRVIPWYSEQSGFITGEIIEKDSGEIRNSEVYICGPLSFMRGLRNQFIKKGVDKKSIHFEEFNFL